MKTKFKAIVFFTALFGMFLFLEMVCLAQTVKSNLQAKIGSINQLCSGVNIHFTSGHEQDLDMIAAAGFKFIRMDFVHQNIERTEGTYNWEAYDELTANLEKRGLRALYIMHSSRANDSPQTSESVAAFARWAATAAEHYRGKNIIWEIWNEPNGGSWRPKADAVQYSTLALATCKAIKAVVPDAVIIGPATAGIPFNFIEPILSSGVLEYLDAVSVHPYRGNWIGGPTKAPETAISDYQKLREMIDRYAPASKKGIPIISSEWGYSNFILGVPQETQAAFLVRMQLSNLSYGVPLSIWYDWKNDGTNPVDNEHNFGTVTNDLKPKPVYITAQTMNMQMKGFTFIRRIDLKNENNFALLFRNDKGEYKISAWTIGHPHTVLFDLDIQEISKETAVDGKGNALKLNIYNGRVIGGQNEIPHYITRVTAVDGKGNDFKPNTYNGRLIAALNEMPQYITFQSDTKIE